MSAMEIEGVLLGVVGLVRMPDEIRDRMAAQFGLKPDEVAAVEKLAPVIGQLVTQFAPKMVDAEEMGGGRFYRVLTAAFDCCREAFEFEAAAREVEESKNATLERGDADGSHN